MTNNSEYWNVTFLILDQAVTYKIDAHCPAEASRKARDELYSNFKNQRAMFNDKEYFVEPRECVVVRDSEFDRRLKIV